MEVALQLLAQEPAFQKKNGGVNVHQISSLLGMDNKTVKGKLRRGGLKAYHSGSWRGDAVKISHPFQKSFFNRTGAPAYRSFRRKGNT